MSETNIIKSITVHTCPLCSGEILVESQMKPPMVSSIFTPEMVNQAKKDCLERLQSLTLPDEKREAVTKWLQDPNTIFGPGEIESIILSLIKPEE